MVKHFRGVAIIGVMMASAAAQADVGIGLKGGSLGTGVELTKSFTPSLNGRVGFNSFTYNTTATESDIEYDVDFELRNTAAILDWHPFEGGFRLSAGYVFNNNSIGMKGRPTNGAQFEVGDDVYTLDSFNGEVSFSNGAYIGMGWGNAGRGKGLGVSFELGAVYQGSPEFEASATGSDLIVNDPVFQQNLAQEEADVEDAIADYKWYPAIALGLSYTF